MADNREFKSNLLVTSSPHYVTKLDTRKTMFYVIVALLFPTAAATFYFGIAALYRVVMGAIFASVAEWLYNLIMKKKDTTEDLSAVVTGMILALNVPSNFPVWMLAIGCGVSIVIVKALYGGLGRNFANPALVGRVVLLVSWTSYMTTWPLTRFQMASCAFGADAITGATPLGDLASGMLSSKFSLFDLYVGNVGGALGETCAAAIILGGVFLIWKEIISPIIPCAFIGTVFVIALLYYAVNPVDGYNAFQMALVNIFAGGVFFGAFFCATDYVTSPVMKQGKLIFGIGCGALTMMIRILGSYPEGVSFAILLMNIATPLIDHYVERSYYGIAKAEKAAKLAAKAEAGKEAAK